MAKEIIKGMNAVELQSYLSAHPGEAVNVYVITAATSFLNDEDNCALGFLNEEDDFVDSVRWADCFYLDKEEASKKLSSLAVAYRDKMDFNEQITFVLKAFDEDELLDMYREAEQTYDFSKFLCPDYGEEIALESVEYQYKDIAGSICVSWQWEQHVGYCRRFLDIFVVSPYDSCHDESLLVDEDKTYIPFSSMLLSPEEMTETKDPEKLYEILEKNLLDDNKWKWTYSHDFLRERLKEFCFGE